MDFVSNREAQIEEMLKALGIGSIDDLLTAIPAALKLPPPKEDDGMSEYEGMKLIEALSQKNTYSAFKNYMGGGAYEHHIPPLVGMIASRSEFLTSYTPYQPECSQGMLQVIFEYQSALCALTGMEVANASVYDGASASAEAVLMALRINNERNKIVLYGDINPNYLGVIDQYTRHLNIEVIHTKKLEADSSVAAVIFQSPNYLGFMEKGDVIVKTAHEAGALAVQIANPLSFGLYKSAGEMGVDICAGDTQPFGLPLMYGGPYAGYMACKKEFVRHLPGRIVGETVDFSGRRGFCLTLQTREQHIRREKATSNLCTNQALAALSSLVALLWYGKEGIQKLALTNFQRASYLRELLKSFNPPPGDIFNEFPLSFGYPHDKVEAHFRSRGIQPGVRGEGDQFIVAVTETKTVEDLQAYARAAKELNENDL